MFQSELVHIFLRSDGKVGILSLHQNKGAESHRTETSDKEAQYPYIRTVISVPGQQLSEHYMWTNYDG